MVDMDLLSDKILDFNEITRSKVRRQDDILLALKSKYTIQNPNIGTQFIDEAARYCLYYWLEENVCGELFIIGNQLDQVLAERNDILKAQSVTIPTAAILHNNLVDLNTKHRELHFLMLHYVNQKYKSDKNLLTDIQESDIFSSYMKQRYATPDQLLIQVFGGERYIRLYDELIANRVRNIMRSPKDGDKLRKLYEEKDLMNEGRYAALMFIRNFRPGSKSLSSWLYHPIIDRHFVNILKSINRGNRRVNLHITELSNDTKTDIYNNINNSVAPQSNYMFENKLKQLTQLSDRQRLILILKSQEKSTIEEIAERLALSKKTVQRDWNEVLNFGKNHKDLIKRIFTADPIYFQG